MEINEIYNEANLKISKHFIAYLDILGYEKHLDHWGGPEMFLATMSNVIESTRRGIKLMNDYADSVDAKLKVFSDNFLLCSENGWESLLYFVMLLNLIVFGTCHIFWLHRNT